MQENKKSFTSAGAYTTGVSLRKQLLLEKEKNDGGVMDSDDSLPEAHITGSKLEPYQVDSSAEVRERSASYAEENRQIENSMKRLH